LTDKGGCIWTPLDRGRRIWAPHGIPSCPHPQPFGNWMEKDERLLRWRVELQIAPNT
jgi:hypothetical protein